MATMGETTRKDKWWKTAQPGDQFSHPRLGKGQVIDRVGKSVEVWIVSFERGAIWRDDIDSTRRHLEDCTPLHVENMRRHVAATLEAGGEVKVGGIVATPRTGRVACLVRDGSTAWHDTPGQAAEALIPDDWQPPGGAS